MKALLRGLVGLLLAASLYGCHRGPAPVAPAPVRRQPVVAASRSARPSGLFLYAVERGPRRSFVMGTMHMGFGFEEVLTEEARASFASVHRVMVEADVTGTDAGPMMQAALLDAGQSLQAMLGDPLWKVLVARVGKTVPPPVLDKLRPWMPAVILGLDDMHTALQEVRPRATAHMMDAELAQAAKRAGKKVLFLETVEEQLSVFESIPEAEQVAELRRALQADNAALGRAMLEAYARGDEAALTATLFDEAQMRAAPGFYDAVLFQRNARWMPRIEAEIRAGRVFVAVGAAHLYGSRGLLAELRRRGYVVTRVER